MAFHGLCDKPQWSDEKIKWYMLSKPAKKLNHRPDSKLIPAGRIFEVDYNESFSKDEDKKLEKIILKGCITGKYKLKWSSKLFYGLDETIKNILLAVDQPELRLKYYEEHQDLLVYVSQLEIDEEVFVQVAKKKSTTNVWGTIKYIGPFIGNEPATIFGIEFKTNCGDSNGKKSGHQYFKCPEKRGTFLPFTKILLPPNRERKMTTTNTGSTGELSIVADLGLTDNPTCKSYIKSGDEVLVPGKVIHGEWMDKVHGRVLLVHGNHVAVEVAKSEGAVFQLWDGKYLGNTLLENPSKQTVFLPRDEVEIHGISLKEDQESSTSHPQRDTKRNGYGGATSTSNIPTNHPRPGKAVNVSETITPVQQQMKQDVESAKNYGSRKEALHQHPLQELASPVNQLSGSHDRVPSTPVCEPRKFENNVPSGNSSRSLDYSGNWDSDRPQSSEINQKKSSGSWIMSKILRANPPPFPLTPFHTDVISQDNNLCENLAKSLGLEDKWLDIQQHEQKPFFRVEFLLKFWWDNIHEGHKKELQRMTDLLAIHGRDDLRDYINKTPGRGNLHETVMEAFLTSGRKLASQILPYLKLAKEDIKVNVSKNMTGDQRFRYIMHIWQEKHPEASKLDDLVGICEAVHLFTLASRIEQGLSKPLLTQLARKIPKAKFTKLCSKLHIPELRFRAFSEKYHRLEDRVFETLKYWSMIQPLSTKKIAVLHEALSVCDLRKLADDLLYRDLRDDELETTVISVDNKWKSLAIGLKMTDKDIEVLKEEQSTSTEKAMEVLCLWKWRNLYKVQNLKEELYTRLIGCGQWNAANLLYDASERGHFHETVIKAFAGSVKMNWTDLVSILGLKADDVNTSISEGMGKAERLKFAMLIWQERNQGTQKLYHLINLCTAVDLPTLASEIEQGLSEVFLTEIASKIPNDEWESLCSALSVPNMRRDALSNEYRTGAEKYYQLLASWSMMQPLSTKKIATLYDALSKCGLQQLANDQLYKELPEEDIEATAVLLGAQWQKLAVGLDMNKLDIENLQQETTDAIQKALKVLELWKWRHLTLPDLKKALHSKLTTCGQTRAAKELYHGFDPETITYLSRKLCFDWPVLAKEFGYKPNEITDRLMRSGNQVERAHVLLKEWLNVSLQGGPKETKTKLDAGLMAIGRHDIIAWMGDPSEGNNVQERTEKRDSSQRLPKLDKMMMNNISTSLEKTVDVEVLKDYLAVKDRDINVHLPKSINFNSESAHFVILACWKRMQQNKHNSTETECINQLVSILELYGQEKAVACLKPGAKDGSSVDPEWYGTSGAVGGVPEEPINLSENAMVEFQYGKDTLNGTIIWTGYIKGLEEHGKIAGLELEEFLPVFGGDGEFGGKYFFRCQHGKGLYLPLDRCKPDSRFITEPPPEGAYGGVECDPIDEPTIAPPETVEQDHVGLFKGIQGNHNSCYMDVTLYSMFAYNDVFDAILEHSPRTNHQIAEIKDALRSTIVNPLRRIGYVRADHLFNFRDLLNDLSSMKGLRTEEKDPEEFIHTLLQELLSAQPFLKISQGTNAVMESYVYQIFLDQQDRMRVPTVSELLHLSFLQSDLKLAEAPQCLIIQLPRYGKKYKLFDYIKPSLVIDIKLLIRKTPRICSYCGKLAFMECKDCRPMADDDDLIQSFCGDCFKMRHAERKLKNHKSVPLDVPSEFVKRFQEIERSVHDEDDVAMETAHLYQDYRCPMELFSAVCIETSHYVAFVKTGSGDQEEWVFFDSMADRSGDEYGYNIPEVTHLRAFRKKMESSVSSQELKKAGNMHLKRLLSDAYICFYRPLKTSYSIQEKEMRHSASPEWDDHGDHPSQKHSGSQGSLSEDHGSTSHGRSYGEQLGSNTQGKGGYGSNQGHGNKFTSFEQNPAGHRDHHDQTSSRGHDQHDPSDHRHNARYAQGYSGSNTHSSEERPSTSHASSIEEGQRYNTQRHSDFDPGYYRDHDTTSSKLVSAGNREGPLSHAPDDVHNQTSSRGIDHHGHQGDHHHGAHHSPRYSGSYASPSADDIHGSSSERRQRDVDQYPNPRHNLPSCAPVPANYQDQSSPQASAMDHQTPSDGYHHREHTPAPYDNKYSSGTEVTDALKNYPVEVGSGDNRSTSPQQEADIYENCPQQGEYHGDSSFQNAAFDHSQQKLNRNESARQAFRQKELEQRDMPAIVKEKAKSVTLCTPDYIRNNPAGRPQGEHKEGNQDPDLESYDVIQSQEMKDLEGDTCQSFQSFHSADYEFNTPMETDL